MGPSAAIVLAMIAAMSLDATPGAAPEEGPPPPAEGIMVGEVLPEDGGVSPVVPEPNSPEGFLVGV